MYVYDLLAYVVTEFIRFPAGQTGFQSDSPALPDVLLHKVCLNKFMN